MIPIGQMFYIFITPFGTTFYKIFVKIPKTQSRPIPLAARSKASFLACLLVVQVPVPLGHGCLSVVSVVCCQVEVCAASWSLVQRSLTDSLCVCVSPSVFRHNNNPLHLQGVGRMPKTKEEWKKTRSIILAGKFKELSSSLQLSLRHFWSPICPIPSEWETWKKKNIV